MSVDWPKAAVWIAALAIGAIRGAHSYRKPAREVSVRLLGAVQRAVMILSVAGFVVPLFWASTSWLDRFDYPWPPLPRGAGLVVIAGGLWLFHQTHVDIGSNWSATLQITAQQRLVTSGVYGRIRHPMYLSLLLYGTGQALLINNWIAGPACLAGTIVLAALRIPPEERMLRQRFGADYERYAATTPALVPRLT